jgi:RimJ/RimL family protein N-acetyltransferase
MKSPLTKDKLLNDLPIIENPLVIRSWRRDDLETLAAWPNYPFPYRGFELPFVSMDSIERDWLFVGTQDKSNTIPLVIDHTDQPGIGYLSLTRIDWVGHRVGNFGFRIHPGWVNKGIGTSVLRKVCSWSFNCGISTIGVDVAASNLGAVCCYEKAGFYTVGETWREAEDLVGIDIADIRYDFLHPHLRWEGELPELRFFLMERTHREIHYISGSDLYKHFFGN